MSFAPKPALVVHRLDRFGRSTRDVLNLVHELAGKGAALRVLEPDLTTAGDLDRLVVTVLGMVADMELKFIRDRQRAGIDAAKAKGVYRGTKTLAEDPALAGSWSAQVTVTASAHSA